MLALYLQKFENETDKILFSQIYTSYEQRMYKIAYKYLNNVQLAEDCVNDAFLAVINSFESFAKLDGDKRGRYIYTITERCAYRLFSKEKKQADIADTFFSEPVRDSITVCDKIDIMNALEKMPFEYSYPLFLRYAQELTYTEIAKVLNLTEAASRQRVKRAKEKLANIISEGELKNV